MDLGTTLHRVPDFLMAALACWLGLSLWARAPRQRVNRVFAWFCLTLTVYGLSAVLGVLTTDRDVGRALERVQIMATLVTPAAFLHFIMALVQPEPPVGRQRLALIGFYLSGIVLGMLALFGRMELVERAPEVGPLPWAPWGELHFGYPALDALWVVQRVVPLLLALWLMADSYRRREGLDPTGQRQRQFFVLAAIIGVLGAVEATIARELAFTPAPGRMFIVLALGALAYAVLAYRSLLPPRVAQRTFLYSLIGGLITIAYVSVLLLMEWLVRHLLDISTPVLTAVALVLLAALFGPIREWLGSWLDRRFFRREFDYSRLLNALSADLLSRGDLDEQFEPLLGNVCRAIGARAGLIAVQHAEGLRVVAGYGVERPGEWSLRHAILPDKPQIDGEWQPWPPAQLILPLSQNGSALGALALGPRRAHQPYSSNDQQLLRAVASYLAVAVAHHRIREQEQRAVAALTEQGRVLREQQESLARQANAAIDQISREPLPTPVKDQSGLRVYCLGPLRVERDGEPITRWGGNKAGTYQAEALFAFLFDRRGRGLTKDEAEEVIWPDQPIESADQAFHRTLSALRRVLEPQVMRPKDSRAITYHHERYWLEPGAIAWSDVDQFDALVARGQQFLGEGQPEQALATLQEAVALYRGAYMDDCPFFGDSTYVEERRAVVQAEQVEALLAISELLEQQGRVAEARSSYRRALSAAGGDCPRAEDALARLGDALTR